MLTRREFIRKSAQAGAALALPLARTVRADDGVEVNDVQSQLNAARVGRCEFRTGAGFEALI